MTPWILVQSKIETRRAQLPQLPQLQQLKLSRVPAVAEWPLHLVRGVPEHNGLEAWRILMNDMQPPRCQRSLALVPALNKLKFDGSKSITEQLPQLEILDREYERTSKQVYPDDLKVAAVVSALPKQMGIQESTTYEELTQIELYE